MTARSVEAFAGRSRAGIDDQAPVVGASEITIAADPQASGRS